MRTESMSLEEKIGQMFRGRISGNRGFRGFRTAGAGEKAGERDPVFPQCGIHRAAGRAERGAARADPEGDGNFAVHFLRTRRGEW